MVEINIIVIGAGAMGRLHINTVNRLGHLAGFVDSNSALASLAQRLSVPFFSSVEELSKSDLIVDGVIIAVPTSLHFAVFKEIIEKHVCKFILVEKPLTRFESLQAFVDLAHKSNVHILVGHSEVFEPTIGRISEVINSGILGEIKLIQIRRLGHVEKDRLRVLDSVLDDILPHTLDVLFRINGKMSGILFASGSYTDNVLNSATIIMETETCIVSHIISRESHEIDRSIVIQGEYGSIYADSLSQIVEINSLSEEGRKKPEIMMSIGKRTKLYGDSLTSQLLNFIDVIQGNDVPVVGLEDGVRCLQIINKIRESIDTGLPVRFDIQ